MRNYIMNIIYDFNFYMGGMAGMVGMAGMAGMANTIIPY